MFIEVSLFQGVLNELCTFLYRCHCTLYIVHVLYINYKCTTVIKYVLLVCQVIWHDELLCYGFGGREVTSPVPL